jgi:hypothetical protein
MSIELVARRIDELLPLAWIAVLPSSGSAVLSVLHGRCVEVFTDGFFEGAWDGKFTDYGFDQAVNVFGSGGKIVGGTITFVSPSHTLEPLYIASTTRFSAVSNSLVFLVQHCGLKLDPYEFGYGTALSAIANGLDYTPQRITLQGGSLTILYHHNASLTPDGKIAVVPKTLPPAFPSYDSYSSYLRAVTARVFENARDASRQFHYRPVSTISSGYDSPAVAAIARSCGCDEAVGLGKSNMGDVDSGRSVAESLGMKYTEYERVGRASGATSVEAEFLASGMQGGDLIYNVFEERLAGRIVTTGFLGDKMWEKSNPPNPKIKRGALSGASLGEFRLRVNMLHLPIAFIGCQRHEDISRISNAPEMAAFSVGGGYDRPIPRRILEEMGVPRQAFAQAKRAASVFLLEAQARLSPNARERMAAYCRNEGLNSKYLLLLAPRILWWNLGKELYRVFRRLRRTFGIARGHPMARFFARVGTSLFGIQAPVWSSSHPRFTMVLMWAMSEIGRRYAGADQSSLAHSSGDARHADAAASAPAPSIQSAETWLG